MRTCANTHTGTTATSTKSKPQKKTLSLPPPGGSLASGAEGFCVELLTHSSTRENRTQGFYLELGHQDWLHQALECPGPQDCPSVHATAQITRLSGERASEAFSCCPRPRARHCFMSAHSGAGREDPGEGWKVGNSSAGWMSGPHCAMAGPKDFLPMLAAVQWQEACTDTNLGLPQVLKVTPWKPSANVPPFPLPMPPWPLFPFPPPAF